MRFTVAQMLELLATGMSFDEILEDYPFIEKEAIEAYCKQQAELALRHFWCSASKQA